MGGPTGKLEHVARVFRSDEIKEYPLLSYQTQSWATIKIIFVKILLRAIHNTEKMIVKDSHLTGIHDSFIHDLRILNWRQASQKK